MSQQKGRGKIPAAAKTRHELEKMLEKRNEHPERLTAVDREIWDTFGETNAVWVLDMCGFSRLSMRYGITHFLAMIYRLQAIVRPIIGRHRGRVVKTEADNVFAVFERVEWALASARDVQEQLTTANVFLPADWDLHASIGIGFGELLMISDDDDFYGTELNLASKLGEDIAEPGETLLTEAAHTRLVDEGPKVTLAFDAREIVVSKMALKAYALT
jgi:class 3 adenylate cyclase